MAIKLCAEYSKKLGLPEYSSHSFSASVEIELNDISQVANECQRLYGLLQHSVDQEIQEVGFVPSKGYGKNGTGNAQEQNHQRVYLLGTNGKHPHGDHKSPGDRDQWNCTEGQRGFILRILNESNMDFNEAETLSMMLFHIGVKECDKTQASQLIQDLLVKAGKPPLQTRWKKTSSQQRAA